MGKVTVEEVKTFLDMKGIVLDEESEYQYQTNFINTCNKITNNKLSGLELMLIDEILSDLMTNQRPDLAVIKDRDDLIKIPYEFLEKLEESKGKLTTEEKTKLAFASYASIFIKTIDLKTGKPRSILEDFKTIEEFKKLYFNYKSRNPEMFDFSGKIWKRSQTQLN